MIQSDLIENPTNHFDEKRQRTQGNTMFFAKYIVQWILCRRFNH